MISGVVVTFEVKWCIVLVAAWSFKTLYTRRHREDFNVFETTELCKDLKPRGLEV